MSRQFLDPIGNEPVDGVVGRLGAIAAGSEFGSDLSINTRRTTSTRDDVKDALVDGRLIKTFAFRGATHLMTVDGAAVYLALRASSRMWELPSWQSYYGLAPSDWPAFRAAVRDALANGPLTRAALGAAVTRNPRYANLGFVFTADNWTLLKPLTWLGDMSFSPNASGRAMFQRLDTNPRWRGLLHIDDAGVEAVKAYLSAYGPATAEHLNYWLGNGLGAGRRKVASWLKALGDMTTQVDVDGTPALVLSEHVEALRAAGDAGVVRLLPGVDQWMIGPGTADTHVTPAIRRTAVTRGSNVVIKSGVVSGTWTLKNDVVRTESFDEAGPFPRDAIADEVMRIGGILGRSLVLDG